MKPGRIPSFIVVGGMTLDLAIWIPELPLAGSIMHARRGEFFTGGKGFNQAICAKRCGAEVHMVGVLGNDPFANLFLDTLDDEGIDSTFISRVPIGTSFTFPLFHEKGENALIGLPRSNRFLYPDDIIRAKPVFQTSDAALIQLEIPMETAAQAVRLAGETQLTVFVNPSPMGEKFLSHIKEINRDLDNLLKIDWLILNQKEAEAILDKKVSSVEEVLELARELQENNIQQGVVITMGEQGSVLVSGKRELFQPAFPSRPVYPLGAGDTFTAAFAVRIMQDDSPEKALRFAAAAGALAASRYGSADSQPTLLEIQQMLSAYPDITG